MFLRPGHAKPATLAQYSRPALQIALLVPSSRSGLLDDVRWQVIRNPPPGFLAELLLFGCQFEIQGLYDPFGALFEEVLKALQGVRVSGHRYAEVLHEQTVVM